jgi:hypothetical protein
VAAHECAQSRLPQVHRESEGCRADSRRFRPYRADMAHEGTLILPADDGGERRVRCDGGLDSYASSDGGLRIRGVVNLKGEGLEEARQLMERSRSGNEATARYTGEVYGVDRRDVRLVSDMRVRIEGIDETGNVRVESDESLSA